MTCLHYTKYEEQVVRRDKCSNVTTELQYFYYIQLNRNTTSLIILPTKTQATTGKGAVTSVSPQAGFIPHKLAWGWKPFALNHKTVTFVLKLHVTKCLQKMERMVPLLNRNLHEICLLNLDLHYDFCESYGSNKRLCHCKLYLLRFMILESSFELYVKYNFFPYPVTSQVPHQR
jgi:hypothetical protein